MTGIYESHMSLTSAPIDNVIAIIRERQAYATFHAESWSRSQSPRSEQYAARDRDVAARLGQLVRAIEAGLFDQLDASDTGRLDASLLSSTPLAVAFAASPAAVEPKPFAVGDVVNVSDADNPYWGLRVDVVSTGNPGGDVDVEFADGTTHRYTASQLMHHTEFVKQPQEYFDEAEAEDVRAIRREMAEEAGDFDPADETDGGAM